MYLQVTPITLILLFTALLLLTLSYYLFLQKRSQGVTAMLCLLIAGAIWAFSLGVESTLNTIEGRVLWSKISYIGIVSVSPLWLIFTLQYSQVKEKIIHNVKFLIWIIPTTTLILTFSNELHNLIWTTYTPIKTIIEDGLMYGHGPFFIVHMIYSYSLLVTGSVVLAQYILRKSKEDRLKSSFILLAIFFPWVANIIYIFIAPTLLEVELTPIALSITAIVLIFGVLRYQVLTVIPIAKEAIFTHIENAIIILDDEGNVIEYNPVAKLLFRRIFINTNLFNIDEEDEDFFFLPELVKGERKRRAYYHHGLKRWYDAAMIEVKDKSGDFLGTMVYLHDISQFKKNSKR